MTMKTKSRYNNIEEIKYHLEVYKLERAIALEHMKRVGTSVVKRPSLYFEATRNVLPSKYARLLGIMVALRKLF